MIHVSIKSTVFNHLYIIPCVPVAVIIIIPSGLHSQPGVHVLVNTECAKAGLGKGSRSAIWQFLNSPEVAIGPVLLFLLTL